MAFVRKIKAQYGKISNLWLMDRGVPTEETFSEMRDGGYKYLVEAPQGRLDTLGDKLKKSAWEEVQPGIRVKVARPTNENGWEGDIFILMQSDARSIKEVSMRVKKLRGAMKILRALDTRIGQAKLCPVPPPKRTRARDELISRRAGAKSKARRAWKLISIAVPEE